MRSRALRSWSSVTRWSRGSPAAFVLVPPGGLILVASASKPFEQVPIRLWNFETGQLVHEFGGFDVKPDSLAVSPDGRRFAAAFQRGDDRGKEFRAIVLLWDLEHPGEPPVEVLMEKGLMFPGVQTFTPDGRKLLIATETRLDVLDLETKRYERTMTWSEVGMFKGAMCAAVSPDGRLALTAGWDATGRVWDLRTGTLAATMVGHKAPIQRAAFDADGAGGVVDVSLDTTIKVWDVKTGDSLTTLRGQDPLFSVAVTPDGTRAAAGDGQGHVSVWDLNVDRQYFRDARRFMCERMQSLPEPDRATGAITSR